MFKQKLKAVFAVVMLSSMTTFAYSEDAAPVYDVDNFPPQFDGASEMPLSDNTSGNQNNNQNTQIASNTYTPSSIQSMSLDQRIARAERQINNLQSKDLAAKVDTLQNEIQSLRGQVEQLTHQLQQSQKALMNTKLDATKLDLSKNDTKITPSKTNLAKNNDSQDLRNQVEQLTQQIQQLQSQQQTQHSLKSVRDTSVSKKELADASSDSTDLLSTEVKTNASKKGKLTSFTEASSSRTKTKYASTSAGAGAALNSDVAPQPNVAEEQQIYQTAYDLIKAKKYNDAIFALQKMLRKYPTGQFAANAHYWLGELFGLLGKNDQSAQEFGNVVVDFPDSPKVSDAQLKLGLIYAAQFKWVDAKAAFKKVINQYPGTASARLAAEQLKQIKEAGH